jgi:hypothetical protein
MPGPTQEMRTAVQLTGATGFAAGERYATAAPGGEAGVVSGFGALVLFKLATKTANRVMTGTVSTSSPNSGWSLDTLAAGSVIGYSAFNGVGAQVSAPTYSIQDSDLGKIMGAAGQHDGTAVYTYVNRAQVGASTAIVGYTASAVAQGLGSRGTSFPCTGMTIYGVMTWRGVKTLAQIQALFDDIKLARDVLGSGMAATNAWSFKRAGGAAPPASVANLAGADVQTRVGSALVYDTTTNAVWGW